ncbi:chromobox protein 3-like [Aphis craccivora]|uniref:Chromobox protein 3-like n=1 Tax=Aphis craccivora TaxID=307492 RepID=A0A6G0VX12_APHCR|nr:chromobox protein 3-like [Aphis craccivora]
MNPRKIKLITLLVLKCSRSKENENHSDSSNREYRVEKILHKRIKAGHIEYLLKWHGYNEFSNSWEPKTNLTTLELYTCEYLQKYGLNNAAPPISKACAGGTITKKYSKKDKETK